MKISKQTIAGVIALSGIGAVSSFYSSGANAQSVLDKVNATGKITVATEVSYPPMEYLEGGKVVGYGKDILDLLVKEMDVDLEQLQLPWEGILAGVLAQKYDMVATSVAIKADRVNKYAFTRPLAVADTILIKRYDDKSLINLDDINGKIVGVELGSSQAKEAEVLNEKLKADGGSGFTKISGFKSGDDMRFALVGGQVDLVASPSFSLGAMQKQRPKTFTKLTTIGTGILFAWVMHPEGTDLRDRVNEILNQLESDGTLAKLQMKWFGFEMDLPANYLPENAL